MTARKATKTGRFISVRVPKPFACCLELFHEGLILLGVARGDPGDLEDDHPGWVDPTPLETEAEDLDRSLRVSQARMGRRHHPQVDRGGRGRCERAALFFFERRPLSEKAEETREIEAKVNVVGELLEP